jgi:serine protease AprX
MIIWKRTTPGWFAAALALFLLCGAATSGEIAPSVARWLETASPDETVAAWVFLRDKGSLSDAETEALIRQAGSRYDAKAISRRLLVRPERPFGEADLPLHRPYVRAIEDLGVEFRSFSKWLNAVSIVATPDQLERVVAQPFVARVSRVSGRKGGPEPPGSEPMKPGPSALTQYGFSYRQLQQIQVPALHGEGYTGTGVRLAVFDTGFWLGHESVSGINLIAQHDFINDDDETANEPGDPEYQHFHGTQVLSAVGGNSPAILIGPAYNAEYILAKTEDTSQEEPIEEDWWIEAVEWADSLGAQLITSSLCYKDWYTYEDMDGDTAPITIAADMAVLNGIVVTNAAGNSGASSWKYILAPADGDSVISVGSVDSTGVRSVWSSQGPTYDGRIKPTIMAMGSDTYIADPFEVDTYRHGSGTSFATPLVAGALALVLEKKPLWGPAEIINAVMATGTQALGPDSLYGWGILQAYDASEYDVSGVAGTSLRGQRLLVYPNPSTGRLVVMSPAPGATHRARLYDIMGRLLGEFDLSGSAACVDLEAMSTLAVPAVVFVKVPGAAPAKVIVLR